MKTILITEVKTITGLEIRPMRTRNRKIVKFTLDNNKIITGTTFTNEMPRQLFNELGKESYIIISDFLENVEVKNG